MKLLVCTQTVDTQDPALGFFIVGLKSLQKAVSALSV
jgi:hypothetical protein